MLLSHPANTDTEGAGRNESVKRSSSGHEVAKNANVIYSK